eukprot:CAMPEP_0172499760 /NCGR_PEP_ID=MMETSP1066-20121228/130577_1 /TAXON_ID=671091 /ORGANISM="Coscinodiscus wailesii, Strain CCMP2513" /LENGTH=363 /DNA_ID=CAMNT_0013273673 /DNA_START=209 /DNA_END=1300 /DNA_ORIENTATION=-
MKKKGQTFDLSKFTLKETLGTGTFGRVRLASYDNKKNYALKILKKRNIIELKQTDHIKSEISILSKIDHPFIVNKIGHFQDERHLYMVIEYVQGGELYTHLRNCECFPDDQAKFYAMEIVCAFEYLHKTLIIYRDLKPENILITTDGHLKITDFGFAKLLESSGALTWTLCGTPEYLAPEVIQCQGHGKSVDWWTLGILVYEMLAGYPPFYDHNPFGIYQKILTGDMDYPREFHKPSKSFVKKLLTRDRTKRMGCTKKGVTTVKAHKWFLSYDAANNGTRVGGIDSLWEKCLACQLDAPWKPHVENVEDTCHFDDYPDSSSDEEGDEEEEEETTREGGDRQRRRRKWELSDEEQLCFRDFDSL